MSRNLGQRMTTLKAIEAALNSGKAIIIATSVDIKQVEYYLYRRGIIPYIDIAFKREDIHLSPEGRFVKPTGGLISIKPTGYYIRLKYKF